MKTFEFTICLASDAEPGTGLGGDLLDQLVPRDHTGQPCLRASHLRGLVRDRLEWIMRSLKWSGDKDHPLVVALLGQPGVEHDDGHRGLASFEDARVKRSPGRHEVATDAIFRTAVGDTGSAAARTLRGTEALQVGLSLEGRARLDSDDARLEIGLLLGLRSIFSVGSSRNRGAGACVVKIKGDERSPGTLLQDLERHLEPSATRAWPKADEDLRNLDSPTLPEDVAVSWFRLIFKADQGVCCPARRSVLDVIMSDVRIPASAVQGAILTAVSRKDAGLARATLNHPRARFWPLLPCGRDWEPDLRVPTVASLDLMASKDGSGFQSRLVGDASRQGYRSARGLLVEHDGLTKFWSENAIPREVTAHAVVGKKRNLFSVEAIAPLTWVGVVALPAKVGELLLRAAEGDRSESPPSVRVAGEDVSLQPEANNGPRLQFGRGRGVRGQGSFRLEKLGPDAPEFAFKTTPPAIILQEAAALPSEINLSPGGSIDATEAMRRLARAAGLPVAEGAPAVADAECRFGWNRLGIGRTERVGGMLAARAVLTPGSAVVLERPLSWDELERALLLGLGEGREQAFGAWLPHPGKPVQKLTEELVPPRLEPTVGIDGVRSAERMAQRADARPPSQSQLASLAAALRRGGREGGRTFLKKIREERGSRGWAAWEAFHDDLVALVDLPDGGGERGLKVFMDLLAAENRRGER